MGKLCRPQPNNLTKEMEASKILLLCAVLTQFAGCDQNIEQTLVARVNLLNADQDSLWLVESDICTDKRIQAGWYRDGLWIFRLSSTRGGLSVVTQELTLCKKNNVANPDKIWHSLHGGGEPLIVLSCIKNEKYSCLVYQEGYAPNMWYDDHASP
jgi:hypothetical protein